MKNNSNNIHLLFVIAIALLVSLFIRTVAQSNQHVDIEDIELLNLQKNELILANNQIKEAINEIDTTIKSLDETSNSVSGLTELKEQVAYFERLSGKTKVCGEGVVIIVNDSDIMLNEYQEPEDFIVHDVNLRVLVDELWQAGAEAISINGTRIIFGMSTINCSGPTININSVEHGSPYIIRAIGDRYQLQRKMTEDGSYANTLERFALDIEVNTKVYMEIDGYEGLFAKTFAKVVEK